MSLDFTSLFFKIGGVSLLVLAIDFAYYCALVLVASLIVRRVFYNGKPIRR